MTDNPISHLWDEKIEQGILGTLLMDFDQSVMDEVNPDWFYLHKHQSICQVMKTKPECAGNVELLTDELKRAGFLNDIGGPAYLTKLLGSFSGIYSITDFIQRLQDYASRRRVVEIARKLVNQAVDLKEPILDT